MKTARILHTMLRVGDLQRSIDFYCDVMGMRVLRSFDEPDDFSLTFLGYGDEADTCVLELTYNYGVDSYDLGAAYGHIAIGVEDCEKACNEITAGGGEVTYGPAFMEGLKETIAFVKYPDGYQIELVERPIDWLS
ncbi:lactoylglutathione lyase [Candidatus Thiodiazotropha endoloripes]|uniref:lactoylglutathione lyase n=1 Tax=Candidatus Thiodiazotropha endoloripes TaxID=1818881 RepID=UPI00083DECCB|nr:lactoylglutathione lyase [Candidatus Thiodiazotropha endoloripes]MCG7984635.1 lactoylglutathione lyase [Candidatus Thiodiazotropha lotti]ODB85701.1 lactoylglutathione lyase [Candidatus Thiodiazotropha endoloripes]